MNWETNPKRGESVGNRKTIELNRHSIQPFDNSVDYGMDESRVETESQLSTPFEELQLSTPF